MNKEEMRQKLSNITQIRELLFGEQAAEYERKFTHYQQNIKQIESNIEDLNLNLERFKSDIKEHLLQLKNALSADINTAVDGLEKKLKYLSINTSNELGKINLEIESKTQGNLQIIESTADKFSSQIKHLKAEAEQSHEALEKDLSNLKNQLSEAIEKNLSDLTEAKISRSDLAEVLFELCLKVKGQDANLNEIEYDSGNGYSNGSKATEEELSLLEKPDH